MVIDSHAHLKHGDIAGTECSPEEITETMEKAGIDKSVVFAMSTTTRHSIEMARDAVKKFSNKLIPYVYALPDFRMPVLNEIERALRDLNFKGIKLHAGECRLKEYIIGPVLELAAKYEVPCLIDFGGDYNAAKVIAEKFSKTKIIIAHMGKYLCVDANLLDKFIEIAREYENVFLDISGVVLLWKIKDAVDKIDSEKLIWGTDGPQKSPDTTDFAKTELEKLNLINLTEKEKKNILAGNIISLLKI